MNKIKLNDTERKKAFAKFAKLSLGLTHYELKGDKSKPVVVLIHGISSPSYMWDKNYNDIINAGFQVLRYDLYGRGFSDKPKVKYNRDLFVNQLNELLAYLNIFRKVNLIALSFGGLLAVNFSVKFPEKIDKLILLDPAGFYLKIPSFVNSVLNSFITEFVFKQFINDFLPFLSKRDFLDPANFELYTIKYKEQIAYEGFDHALLSTLRYMFKENSLENFIEFAKLKKKTLLIWGEKDRTVPFKYHKEFIKVVTHTKFYAVKNAAHMPHCEQPTEVNKVINTFLNHI